MKVRLACILGVLALTFSATASAQQTQPGQRGIEKSITGTVVSSSPTSLAIRDENGAESTFDVDSSSTMPASLAAGNRISVRFHEMEGGRRHVASAMTSDVATTATAPAARVAAPEPMPASAGTTGEQLPDTASDLPLLALAGLITIAAGLVLRELRRSAA